ncbi:MAG TPA: hypothetical protein VFC30_03145 [Solirubrobacteraceae bacterium]|nr:hypothetical protein [Solirubrobacteraceae bacterium]
MVRRFTLSERAVHWLTALAFFSLLISGLVVGRRGTFHDVMYAWHLASAGVLVLVAGHLYMALVNRATRHALRGMLTGEVDREWARKHYPRWEP